MLPKPKADISSCSDKDSDPKMNYHHQRLPSSTGPRTVHISAQKHYHNAQKYCTNAHRCGFMNKMLRNTSTPTESLLIVSVTLAIEPMRYLR
jgi:hypothetical protein